MGEDLGSMLERSFGSADLVEFKKISGIFSGYKRFTKIELQTLPNPLNLIKHFPYFVSQWQNRVSYIYFAQKINP